MPASASKILKAKRGGWGRGSTSQKKYMHKHRLKCLRPFLLLGYISGPFRNRILWQHQEYLTYFLESRERKLVFLCEMSEMLLNLELYQQSQTYQNSKMYHKRDMMHYLAFTSHHLSKRTLTVAPYFQCPKPLI